MKGTNITCMYITEDICMKYYCNINMVQLLLCDDGFLLHYDVMKELLLEKTSLRKNHEVYRTSNSS